MELVQCYVGSEQPFWNLPYQLPGHLAPKGWIQFTWEELSATNLSLRGPLATIPSNQESDIFIMDELVRHDWSAQNGHGGWTQLLATSLNGTLIWHGGNGGSCQLTTSNVASPVMGPRWTLPQSPVCGFLFESLALPFICSLKASLFPRLNGLFPPRCTKPSSPSPARATGRCSTR